MTEESVQPTHPSDGSDVTPGGRTNQPACAVGTADRPKLSGGVIAFEWVRSNIEVFLIAFVLAMTIRCFCIDGFKIPSGSMEPTLMGNPSSGDRIIADKFRIFFTPIRRFDVILFKYPLDRTKNFIKRVVGIPNEEIKADNGNIYYKPEADTNFHLARKPLDIQESIWIPAWQWQPELKYIEEEWNLPVSDLYTMTNNSLVLNPGLSGTAEASLYLKEKVRDKYNGKGGSNVVPDIKIGFRCNLVQEIGSIEAGINTYAGRFTFCLSANGEGYLGRDDNKICPIKTDFRPQTDHLLEFIHYDGMVYLKLNKRIIAKYEYNNDNQLDILSPQVAITASHSETAIWDVNIYRDVYYTLNSPSEVVKIPEGKYFVIGDNVPNSRDSRAWRVKTIYLKNGRVIECDADPDVFKQDDNNYKIVYDNEKNRGGDVWGNIHRIPKTNSLGLSFTTDKEGSEHITIQEVDSNVNLYSGDILIEFGGEKVNNISQVKELIRNKIGKEVSLKVQREGTEITCNIALETVLTEEVAPFVDVNNIFGRALFVYWPFSHIKIIR